MFEIDKTKFGEFVAQLRKEKGLLQKDLAEALHISDKAVSKWERGLSIPDVALLVPLAQLLGVSVTELLECHRLPKDVPMDSRQTEELVKKVIVLSEVEQRRFLPGRIKRGVQLLLCAAIGCLEIGILLMMGFDPEELSASLSAMMGLMAGFGLYFCCFTREKLPRYYDENRISSFSDGVVRMNIPGVYVNNRNWPYIVRAGQLWAMIGLVASPLIYFLLHTFLPAVWNVAGVYIILMITLGGLFLPMFLVARKYEYAPENPRPPQVKKQDWIWIAANFAIILLLVFVLRGGLASSGSGLQTGWAESNSRSSWSAVYAYHDGYQQRSINTAGTPATLHVEIVSASGTFGMVITDENDNVIFTDDNIETSTFQIPIPGKCKVRVTGEAHKGSFFLSW